MYTLKLSSKKYYCVLHCSASALSWLTFSKIGSIQINERTHKKCIYCMFKGICSLWKHILINYFDLLCFTIHESRNHGWCINLVFVLRWIDSKSIANILTNDWICIISKHSKCQNILNVTFNLNQIQNIFIWKDTVKLYDNYINLIWQ